MIRFRHHTSEPPTDLPTVDPETAAEWIAHHLQLDGGMVAEVLDAYHLYLGTLGITEAS